MTRNAPDKGPLWKVQLAVSAESEDALSEAFVDLFRVPATIYTDAETNRSTAATYLRQKPSRAALDELRDRIKTMRRAGLDIPESPIRIGRIPRQDWAESWKRHFKILRIGKRLIIRPSWRKPSRKKGQAEVILDPGLSFGTGQHPTTCFCLEQIVRWREQPNPKPQSFLDIGTGSGILAISAAKLGYAPVCALDSDPEAVRIARANSRANGVATDTRFEIRDLQELQAKGYDLVCANLMYDLLLQYRKKIIHSVAPRGLLVLAGILSSQFPVIRRAYAEAGWKLVSNRAEGEWKSGAFLHKSKHDQIRN